MSDYKKDNGEIGALWAKTSARGEYFTGSIEIDGVKHVIVVFKNTSKRSDKAPDFRILRSQPREKAEGAPSRDTSVMDADVPFTDSDIPF